ncbi:MAG: hypothetical protein JW720_11350 [Sedimentisphaerales bacterium]|nr:hypothetical protein [Sedimentisphaerales bacterium]
MILLHLLHLVFWIVVLVVVISCLLATKRKKKTWTLDVNGRQHIVELQHGLIFGKRAITLDGSEIELEKSGNLIDTGSEHRFDVDGHACILKIRSSGLTFDYELFLDGKLV